MSLPLHPLYPYFSFVTATSVDPSVLLSPHPEAADAGPFHDHFTQLDLFATEIIGGVEDIPAVALFDYESVAALFTEEELQPIVHHHEPVNAGA
jgi:hypothetical protein